MEFVYYFIIGFVVALINWFFIVSKDTKNNVNVCIGLALATFLWPAVFFGWGFRLADFIAKHYID